MSLLKRLTAIGTAAKSVVYVGYKAAKPDARMFDTNVILERNKSLFSFIPQIERVSISLQLSIEYLKKMPQLSNSPKMHENIWNMGFLKFMNIKVNPC